MVSYNQSQSQSQIQSQRQSQSQSQSKSKSQSQIRGQGNRDKYNEIMEELTRGTRILTTKKTKNFNSQKSLQNNVTILQSFNNAVDELLFEAYEYNKKESPFFYRLFTSDQEKYIGEKKLFPAIVKLLDKYKSIFLKLSKNARLKIIKNIKNIKNHTLPLDKLDKSELTNITRTNKKTQKFIKVDISDIEFINSTQNLITLLFADENNTMYYLKTIENIVSTYMNTKFKINEFLSLTREEKHEYFRKTIDELNKDPLLTGLFKENLIFLEMLIKFIIFQYISGKIYNIEGFYFDTNRNYQENLFYSKDSKEYKAHKKYEKEIIEDNLHLIFNIYRNPKGILTRILMEKKPYNLNKKYIDEFILKYNDSTITKMLNNSDYLNTKLIEYVYNLKTNSPSQKQKLMKYNYRTQVMTNLKHNIGKNNPKSLPKQYFNKRFEEYYVRALDYHNAGWILELLENVKIENSDSNELNVEQLVKLKQLIDNPNIERSHKIRLQTIYKSYEGKKLKNENPKIILKNRLIELIDTIKIYAYSTKIYTEFNETKPDINNIIIDNYIKGLQDDKINKMVKLDNQALIYEFINDKYPINVSTQKNKFNVSKRSGNNNSISSKTYKRNSGISYYNSKSRNSINSGLTKNVTV